MASNNILLNSLIKVRNGFLFEIIAFFILLIYIVIAILSAFTITSPSATLGVIIGLIIIALILVILALVYQYGGFKGLQSFVKNAGLGSTGIIMIVIGIPLSIVIVGYFIAFIGTILIGIATFSIGDKYNNGLVKVGGVLIAVPLLNFIGYILAYVGVGDIIYAVRQSLAQAPSVPTTPNTGTLKGNVANVYVYSQSTAKILSAILEEVQLNAISITPDVLNPGNNYITVMFPQQLPNLMQGGSYRIKLNLDNGSYIEVIVTYQPS